MKNYPALFSFPPLVSFSDTQDSLLFSPLCTTLLSLEYQYKMQPQEKKKSNIYASPIFCVPCLKAPPSKMWWTNFSSWNVKHWAEGVVKKKKGIGQQWKKVGVPKTAGVYFSALTIYIFFGFRKEKKRKGKKGILLTQKRSHSIGAREREPGRPMDIILKKKKAPYGLFWL